MIDQLNKEHSCTVGHSFAWIVLDTASEMVCFVNRQEESITRTTNRHTVALACEKCGEVRNVTSQIKGGSIACEAVDQSCDVMGAASSTPRSETESSSVNPGDSFDQFFRFVAFLRGFDVDFSGFTGTFFAFRLATSTTDFSIESSYFDFRRCFFAKTCSGIMASIWAASSTTDAIDFQVAVTHGKIAESMLFSRIWIATRANTPAHRESSSEVLTISFTDRRSYLNPIRSTSVAKKTQENAANGTLHATDVYVSFVAFPKVFQKISDCDRISVVDSREYLRYLSTMRNTFAKHITRMQNHGKRQHQATQAAEETKSTISIAQTKAHPWCGW